MKEVNKRRLYADLIKYCDQIGILPEETPMLILERKEYHALLVANGDPKHAGGYGECNWQQRTIFVDAGRRGYGYRTYRILNGGDYVTPKLGQSGYHYRLHKRGSTEFRAVKATYRTKLHCLVHELVHYRFGYMGHGKAFEKRIDEVLRGKTFPPKHIDLKGKLHDI